MNEKRWEPLPAEFRNALNQGFRIAKRKLLNLIRLPVWV